ncbi:hypothetical protein [Saccharicrinis fermentans]|uniref:Uncharacterized protein n=1 Tax=Saccharicrinis fermentans DSM 9555 = JCM 21142 TaxID=869213 RepID=W7YD04_9BACT|nr:hypothetical protein [Saccharicrinis fermentans]GAF05363.1 hypothetical protein JCM21142_104095 [Saccharicrinis fermentans DSM 9555 = JCM 21142]
MLKTNKLALLLLTFFFIHPIVHLAAQQRSYSPPLCAGLESLKTHRHSLNKWFEAGYINKYYDLKNTTTYLLVSAYDKTGTTNNNHSYTTHYAIKHFPNKTQMKVIQKLKNQLANSCQKNYGITFGLELALKESNTSIYQAVALDKKEYQQL